MDQTRPKQAHQGSSRQEEFFWEQINNVALIVMKRKWKGTVVVRALI